VASAVAAYDPARHPSRSRPPCSGVRGRGDASVLVAPTGSRIRSVARSSIALTHPTASFAPIPHSDAPTPAPRSFSVARAATLSLLLLSRRQWRGAGERSRTTVLPRIAEVASYDVPVCANVSIVSSRCEYNFRETRSTRATAVARTPAGREGGGEAEGGIIKRRGKAQELAAPFARRLRSFRDVAHRVVFSRRETRSDSLPSRAIPARYAPNFSLEERRVSSFFPRRDRVARTIVGREGEGRKYEPSCEAQTSATSRSANLNERSIRRFRISSTATANGRIYDGS